MNRAISELQEDVMRGKITRRTFLRNAILLGMSLTSAQTLLAACMAQAPAAAPDEAVEAVAAPETGLTLSIAFNANFTTLDPHFWVNWRDGELSHLIFDTGIMHSPQLECEPWVFESWTQLDPHTWQLKIREGITFPNGDPLNAEAIRYTMERILDPDVGVSLKGWQRFEFAEPGDVVDEYTFNMITGAMINPFYYCRTPGTEWAWLPPSYYRGLPNEEAALNPMGSGPYTLVEYKSDLHTILEAKPDYWNAKRIWGGDGTPRWQRYELNIIPEASTRLAALEAGDVDIAHTIPLDQARSLPGPDAAGEPVRAIVGPTGATMFMYIQPQPHTPELKEQQVRLALNHAINWDPINQQLFLGASYRQTAWMVSIHPQLNPNVEAIPFDQEKAKALLADAGVPDGYRLRLVTASNAIPELPLVAQAIAAQYKEVGLAVEVETMEGSLIGKQTRARESPFDLVLWDFGGSYADVGSSMYRMHPDYWPNQTGWVHEEYAELYQLLSEEEALDTDRRNEIAWRMQEILVEDPPCVILGADVKAHAIGPRVNWTPRLDQFVYPWEITLA